jgi:hypothetical protein
VARNFNVAGFLFSAIANIHIQSIVQSCFSGMVGLNMCTEWKGFATTFNRNMFENVEKK